MENKRYWYFRFKESFFDEDTVLNMEAVPIIGDKLVVTLLKLYCHSLKNGGSIKVEKLLPEYSYIIQLAKICRVSSDFMSQAVAYYRAHDLMQVIDSEEESTTSCHFPYVKDNTGKSSLTADYKRERRTIRGEDRQLLPEPERAAAKEDLKAYGAFSNVMLTENEYESFCREYRNAEHVLNNLSLYMEANGVSYSNDYAELLIFAKKDGIENVGDIENISGNGNLNDVQKELYEKLRESAERGCPPLPFVMDILPEDVYQELREIALKSLERR